LSFLYFSSVFSFVNKSSINSCIHLLLEILVCTQHTRSCLIRIHFPFQWLSTCCDSCSGRLVLFLLPHKLYFQNLQINCCLWLPLSAKHVWSCFVISGLDLLSRRGIRESRGDYSAQTWYYCLTDGSDSLFVGGDFFVSLLQGIRFPNTSVPRLRVSWRSVCTISLTLLRFILLSVACWKAVCAFPVFLIMCKCRNSS
jgi:hypothetical protein